jgi:hypothetical protein
MARRAISLHIGLNAVDPGHYNGWSGPLNACEADAADMAAIASARGMHTKTLLTMAATRSAVIDGIRAAAATLRGGDLFFLSYSGHGGQVPDLTGDELDTRDETWCLFDGQLIDDELYRELGSFDHGTRILVLSDSCHSGTVVKAAFYAGARPVPLESGLATPAHRAMPRGVALSTYQKNRAFYDGIAKELGRTDFVAAIAASVILISGCQDNQLSGDGDFNGVFTGRLRQVWAEGNFNGNYRTFHSRILIGMPPYQSPNYFTVGQSNPAFEQEKPFTV